MAVHLVMEGIVNNLVKVNLYVKKLMLYSCTLAKDNIKVNESKTKETTQHLKKRNQPKVHKSGLQRKMDDV